MRVLVAFRNCGRNHLDAIVDSSSGKPIVLDGAQLANVQEECTSFNDVASLRDAHRELAYRYGGAKGGDQYGWKRRKRPDNWGRHDLASRERSQVRRRRSEEAKKNGQNDAVRAPSALHCDKDDSSALNPEADGAATAT